MGLAKQPLTQETRTDRVGLSDELAQSDVRVGGGPPERECERGRHHLARGSPNLLLLMPTPILLHPEAGLERQEDDCHSGQEDTTDQNEIELSIVSHT
jgi:hypothetical protein